MQVYTKGDPFPRRPQGYLDHGVGCDYSLGHQGSTRSISSEERGHYGDMPCAFLCPSPCCLHTLASWHDLASLSSLLSPECGSDWPICNWSQNPCFYFAKIFFPFMPGLARRDFFLMHRAEPWRHSWAFACFNPHDSLGWM